ncbi:MAG TPA: helix-turn-helix domain-containing protein, partial [Polyangiales bacterium]
MAAKLLGALYTYHTHALYVGPLIAAARHKHHAGQVIWAPDGVQVTGEDGCPRRVTLYAVPPHVPHGHGPAAAAAVLWVDRDDLRWGPHPTRLPEQPLASPITPEVADALAKTLLELVMPTDGGTCTLQHPAVKRMHALLDAKAAEAEISVGQLARQSGLSTRQLRHRFTQELGINPSAYRRWRRLRRAMAAIAGGATLTQAALEGGFADGAHFSRVFLAQFGMAPSQAFSAVRF